MRAGHADRGGGPEHHGPRALIQCPLQLDHGFVQVGQRDVGRGEDPVLVGHAPVLGQPPVERAEEQDDRTGVVLERVLVHHAERRKEPDLLQPLPVHYLEAGVAVPVLGTDGLGRSHQLVRGTIPGIAPEVVEQRACRRDRVERGVGHGAVDAAAESVVLPAADVDPLDHPGPVLGAEMARKGIQCFVVVVVGVEDR